MDSITGFTQMGSQLVAGVAPVCAFAGRSTATHGAWQAFDAANGTKPAARHLIDVPSMYGNRRPRSTQ